MQFERKKNSKDEEMEEEGALGKAGRMDFSDVTWNKM